MGSNIILKESNHIDLHAFIRDFLIELEKSVSNLLVSRNWLIHLVKKELTIGLISKSKLINDKGSFNLIAYSLNYTFFENIEDDFGQRPNDVTIGFVLRISNKEIQITRDIVSEFEDIEYPSIEYNNLTKEIKNDILSMSDSYINILISFFKEIK